MRHILFVLMTALAFLSPRAEANDGPHVFDGTFVAANGDVLVFSHPERGLELVPVGDITIRQTATGFHIMMAGPAQTTHFVNFLNHQVGVFTKNGSARHAELFRSTADAILNLRGESIATDQPILRGNWVDERGINHTVEVSRLPNETMERFVKRYQELVDLMTQAFPPKKVTLFSKPELRREMRFAA